MQLIINGKEITMKADTRVALTLQINNLGDISKPNTSFTNSFKIRKLAENIKAFDYLGVAGNNSRIQYSLNTATLLENNIPLLLNGYCEIRDTTSDEYDINVYGTEKNFFTRLKNLSLRDIYPNTFIAYTSPNLATYVNQLSNFVFPSVAQYNGLSIHSGPNFQGEQRTSQTNTLQTTPHFFVKGLFDRIFAYLGYSVKYPMIDDAVFRRLVIPAGRGVSSLGIVYGQNVNLRDVVSELKCDVFVKEIMNRYGLVVQINETIKQARFVRLHDLLLSGNTLDWTDKVDSFVSEGYNIGSYGRVNYYRYAEDNENEMTGRFNIEDETLNEEQTVFQSAFKKPQYWPALYYAELARGVFKTGFQQAWPLIDVAETTANYENGQSQPKEIPFSLMYLKDFEGTVNTTFTSPQGNFTGNFPVRITTRDFLGFQGFLDANYPEVINLLNNVIIVKVKMKLTVLDIYQFDFFNRVYLEQYGSSFYVNRISNFENDKICEVELVKIPPRVL